VEKGRNLYSTVIPGYVPVLRGEYAGLLVRRGEKHPSWLNLHVDFSKRRKERVGQRQVEIRGVLLQTGEKGKNDWGMLQNG